MKDLLIRAASGALYVSVLLGSLFFSKLAFLIVIAILGAITCTEYTKLCQLRWWMGLPLLFLLLAALHQNNLGLNAGLIVSGIAALFNLYLIHWLFFKPATIPFLLGRGILAINIICGFAAISLIPMDGFSFRYEVLIGVLCMLWANDTFAYLVGKNFGKTKLMPTVSPNKTVEGFLGGGAGALAVGAVLWLVLNSFSLSIWISLAVIVVVFGSVGDLVQSRVKRIAKVKDSGVIMPGHGGMYDRLDSLIFAAPFVYLYLILVCYVS